MVVSANLPLTSIRAFAFLLACIFFLVLPRVAHTAAIPVTATGSAGDVDYTVNGNCSIREAVYASRSDAAQDACPAGGNGGPDTIVLPAGTTFSLPVTLAINYTDLNIQGNGSIVERAPDATYRFSVITMSGDTTLAIDDVTIRNGAADTDGGGVYLSGRGAMDLTITNSLITQNEAQGSGGGIYAGDYSWISVRLENSVVSHNAANDSGGGIHSAGATLDIQQTSIEYNTAGSGGGLEVYAPNASNGGSVPLLLIRGSDIHHNTNTVSEGGGMRIVGGGGVAVYDSTFYENTAFLAGGAIALIGTTLLELHRSSLHDNHVTVGGSGPGGIVLYNYFLTNPGLTPIFISNSTLSGNDHIQIGLDSWHSHALELNNTTIIASPGRNAVWLNSSGGSNSITSWNSVIAGSTDDAVNDCSIHASSHTFEHHHSWFEDGSCYDPASGKGADGEPRLGPLADNGGNTLSHKPLPGSGLIDRGSSSPAPGLCHRFCDLGFHTNDDQRGRGRVNRIDIGSIEVQEENIGPLMADLNTDRQTDLADAIIALKIISRFPYTLRTDYVSAGIDANGDTIAGMAEALYLLQVCAGLRVPAAP